VSVKRFFWCMCTIKVLAFLRVNTGLNYLKGEPSLTFKK
jgi:hypothetical protein